MRSLAALVVVILSAGTALAAAPAPLQQGQAASRALATQGVLSLRPADPRILQTMIAQHRAAKAALVLTAPEAADLDSFAHGLRPRVTSAALQDGNLIDAVTAIVAMNAPALSRAEARALAIYTVNETAAVIAAGAANPDLDPALQELQANFNLQYQQLGAQMKSENTSYTAVSAIMKTKHDSVKNSIGNIR